MPARRALMYMPAHDRRKIEKAIGLQVDTLCMDLEDSVSAGRKEEARAGAAEALKTLDFGGCERLVRINPYNSGLAGADLAAILPCHPDGILLPKPNAAQEVEWIDRKMTAAEKRCGWPEGSIKLFVLIETPLAVIELNKICQATPRLQALVFGADDMAAHLRAVRTAPAWEVFYARSAVVLHAAAYGLQAIDMVKIDFHDEEGLRQEVRQGVEMGFTGKQIIHPNQWPVVAEGFTPGGEQIAHARLVLEEFTRQSSSGAGAFALHGHVMIDMPSVRQAENILERARAAGKSVELNLPGN